MSGHTGGRAVAGRLSILLMMAVLPLTGHGETTLERRFTVAKVPLGDGISIKMPLDVQITTPRPEAPDLSASLDNSPSGLALPPPPSRIGIRRARPEFNFRDGDLNTVIRLSGSRLRIRMQNLDQTQQLQFSLKAQEVKLEYRFRF